MIKLTTRPETTKAYDALAAETAVLGVERGAMFGMPSLKANGKAFAGVFGDALVFKLSGAAHEKAIALAGAALFDPSGMGRAMKEWVVVPYAHKKKWEELGHAALDALAAAPAKKKGAAKTSSAAKKKATARTSSAVKKKVATR